MNHSPLPAWLGSDEGACLPLCCNRGMLGKIELALSDRCWNTSLPGRHLPS